MCAGPTIQVKLRDSEHAQVICTFAMRLLEQLVRHEHWMDALVCLDTPEQLRLPEQLTAAGHYSFMHRPLLDDTTVLFLPHNTLQRSNMCAPIKADLDGMPCLAKACNVAMVNDGTSYSLHITPPLVFSFFGGVHKLKLATHDNAACELYFRTDGYFKDSVQKLGPFLLVHWLLVDPEQEVEAERYDIELYNEYQKDVAADQGAGAAELNELEEAQEQKMDATLAATAARAAARRDRQSFAWQLPSRLRQLRLKQLWCALRQHTCLGSSGRRCCGTPTQSWARGPSSVRSSLR